MREGNRCCADGRGLSLDQNLWYVRPSCPGIPATGVPTRAVCARAVIIHRVSYRTILNRKPVLRVTETNTVCNIVITQTFYNKYNLACVYTNRLKKKKSVTSFGKEMRKTFGKHAKGGGSRTQISYGLEYIYTIFFFFC